MNDYIGAIRLIQKINEHPLWMAFISPACLGYLVNIACPESQDPLVICEQQGCVTVSLSTHLHMKSTSYEQPRICLPQTPTIDRRRRNSIDFYSLLPNIE